jgi:hypothetical protein
MEKKMAAEIISSNANEVTIQVTISLKKSMLESEEAILRGTNELGALATEEALTRFDTDGSAIVVNNVKHTMRSKDEKEYQSPYGAIRVKRHVYQTSKGGKIYCPMEKEARIICGATPKLAKTLTHKYSNLPAPSVAEDYKENHGRDITVSYLQKVCDYVGSVAQAKEEDWEYAAPKLDKPVKNIGISLDGANILTVKEGYREGMVGTISLYDRKGERLHTTYVGAAPEYGKKSFLKRFEREIGQAKKNYKKAGTIGVADGAKDNWTFLEKHTDKQILDFWHVTEYLSKASYAIFPKKKQEADRREWLDQRCHDLKNKRGAAGRILMELKNSAENKLSKITREHLNSAITYFENNIEAKRMSYHKFVKENLPVGSGVTEAACKTIIKQRLGGSGMRWKQKGIKMILSLRTLVKTKHRWSEFWEKINLSGLPVLAKNTLC